MTHTLLPHQIEDSYFLATRSFAGNFSGMGSGKTLTALEALRLLGVIEGPPQSTIIVGPPIALRMWRDEFQAYFPGALAQIVKSGTTKLDPDADAIIMSWPIATKRSAELRDLGARVLILDESHAVKSVAAKRTQAILGSGGVASGVAFTWCLTGTPTPKWNDDLYPFLCRADLEGLRERCGGDSLDKFRLRYCITQERKFSPYQVKPTILVVGNRNTDELNEWLFDPDAPLAVRRELQEVWAAMPPLTTSVYYIPMAASPELKAVMDALRGMTSREIDEQVRKNDDNLSTMRRVIGMSKIKAAAMEIQERAESGAGGLLVGAWHTDVIDALAGACKAAGLRTGVLDGRTSSTRKGELQDAFNAGELDVLVGQIAAMGVSLNLQHGGNRIVIVEEDFSPSIMGQFYGRLHRMGQTEHVHVDILRAENKIEEAVARIASSKRREHARLLKQEDAA